MKIRAIRTNLLFLGDVLKGLLEQRPEWLNGSDEGALGGGVGRLHRWSE